MTETQIINEAEIQKAQILSQRPLIRAYLGDCMDWMQAAADKAYDLAIVDPPYGIGTFSQNHGLVKDSYDWNNKIPDKEYFMELKRISDNQIIWGANYYNTFWGKGGAIIWHKENPHPDMSSCEIASNSIEKQVRYYNKRWFGFVGTQNKETNHPCEKPIALYRWLLKNYAKAGQRIFDSHGGSFSSAVACYIEGFDLDICEIDAEYFEAAIKRFRQATQQINLFDKRLM